MKLDPTLTFARDNPSEWLAEERNRNHDLTDAEIVDRYCQMSEVGECIMSMQALSLRALYEDRPHLLAQIAKRRDLDQQMVQEGISLSETLIQRQVVGKKNRVRKGSVHRPHKRRQ